MTFSKRVQLASAKSRKSSEGTEPEEDKDGGLEEEEENGMDDAIGMDGETEMEDIRCQIEVNHIVSSKKFLRTSSSPHKTLPNDKYDAPKEVCGERKLFYRPLKT